MLLVRHFLLHRDKCQRTIYKQRTEAIVHLVGNADCCAFRATLTVNQSERRPLMTLLQTAQAFADFIVLPMDSRHSL